MANTGSETLHLDIQTKFSIETDLVKCIDLHPSEPWVLARAVGVPLIWQ